MKFYSFLLVLSCSLLMVSCQKELDGTIVDIGTTTGGGGGVSTGDPNGLLIKSVSKGTSDSTVSEYTYDASKRLMNLKLYGTPVNGMSINTNTRYVRNASGIITDIIQKSDFAIMNGIDSSTSVVHYDAANSRYQSKLSEIGLLGFSYHDSTVYIYDASGKVTQQVTYQEDFLTGIYSKSTRSDFVYTGANMTNMKLYIYDATTGVASVAIEYAYTYDSKVNPLVYGVDAPIITAAGTEGPNNTSSIKATSTTAAGNFTIGFVYQYNSANKPGTAVSTQTNPSSVKNSVFHYQ